MKILRSQICDSIWIFPGVRFTGIAPYYHVPKVHQHVGENAANAFEGVTITGVAKKLGVDYASAQIGNNPLMNNLNLTVSDMLGGVVRNLKTVLSKYVNISGYALSALISEFTFYIKWAELIDKLLQLAQEA